MIRLRCLSPHQPRGKGKGKKGQNRRGRGPNVPKGLIGKNLQTSGGDGLCWAYLEQAQDRLRLQHGWSFWPWGLGSNSIQASILSVEGGVAKSGRWFSWNEQCAFHLPEYHACKMMFDWYFPGDTNASDSGLVSGKLWWVTAEIKLCEGSSRRLLHQMFCIEIFAGSGRFTASLRAMGLQQVTTSNHHFLGYPGATSSFFQVNTTICCCLISPRWHLEKKQPQVWM